eukprot:1156765-Pelagomonas_calceolata.AAC.4
MLKDNRPERDYVAVAGLGPPTPPPCIPKVHTKVSTLPLTRLEATATGTASQPAMPLTWLEATATGTASQPAMPLTWLEATATCACRSTQGLQHLGQAQPWMRMRRGRRRWGSMLEEGSIGGEHCVTAVEDYAE